MPVLYALLLGIVEGLTEYLPVSSTGHLVLVSHALGLHDDATKTFEVVIQLGAVLAVVVHYRALLLQRVTGVFRKDKDAVRLFSALLAAFVPTAVAGLLLRKAIKAHLFGKGPVVVALIVGGVLMIVFERLVPRTKATLEKLEDVTPKHGFLIGVAQCAALWPGTSRSMATIVGGRALGLSPTVAAEFSFLLALPVLGAATLLDLYKGGKALIATSAARLSLFVGFAVSFVVAWAVIGFFLRFLRTRGLAPFGFYRIALGILVLLLLP